MSDQINIGPTVGYLAYYQELIILLGMPMAEFVDNSVQSYLDNKSRLNNNKWPTYFQIFFQ